MQKFKLTVQKTWFREDEIKTEVNSTTSRIIEANDCRENKITTTITEENEELGRVFGYVLGDEIKILESITFYKDDNSEETIKLMLGDPYYKVENEDGTIKFKHICRH